MIRLSKTRVLEDFFIDDNGVITNKEGEFQEILYNNYQRPCFKSVPVHKIQMWTKYGWRDGKIWAIHHKDKDKNNNSISNLIFMTHSEHSSLHNKGRKHTEEYKKKLSENSPRYWLGKKLSTEHKKKLSDAHKGRKHTEEYKKKLSENSPRYWLGKKLSTEHKKKLSDAHKGIKHTEEYKKKLSENSPRYWLGKHISEDTKKKLSKMFKGRCWFNDGIKSYFIFPEEALPHYKKGRLKCKK